MKTLKFILSVLFLILINFEIANACRCSINPPPCYAIAESDAVFIGTINSVGSYLENSSSKVTVKVEKSFRGMKSQTAVTENFSTSCSWNFETGERYLFYADINTPDLNFFSTNLCTRTSKYDETLTDFNFLNSYVESNSDYLVWGTIFKDKNVPSEGIKAEIIDNQRKIVAISDKFGNLRIPVSKSGKFKIRVFPPKKNGIYLDEIINTSYQKEQEKILKNYNFEVRRPFVEYEVEVKPNQCGWFYLAYDKYEETGKNR